MEAHHCSHLFSSILPQPCPWRFLPPPHFFNPKPSSSFRIYFSTKYPRWDSNAETLRDRKFNFSFRGKGEDDDDDEDVEEFGKKRRWWSDEPPGTKKGTSGTWEEAIDSIWIFKVFKSYGWAFPIIIISWLVATGPKAFLMALALPLGQSALALAFEKLWGGGKSKPKRKSRMRRKPSATSSTVSGTEVKEEPEETQRSRRGKKSYQSWVDNGSVDRDKQSEPSFGGWDDLDRFGSVSGATSGSERMAAEKGKLSKRVGKSDKPLLVRLLIALFPFLGTWTKML
ncbi:putative transmembrane protein [Senna tora]|uniref:Putative transmembrane protein n=1 Tax=Senna tora TaxID=362788 RepID=A0A834X372_9FABA|nr:putative transmembrane protein [Senna tora]